MHSSVHNLTKSVFKIQKSHLFVKLFCIYFRFILVYYLNPLSCCKNSTIFWVTWWDTFLVRFFLVSSITSGGKVEKFYKAKVPSAICFGHQ